MHIRIVSATCSSFFCASWRSIDHLRDMTIEGSSPVSGDKKEDETTVTNSQARDMTTEESSPVAGDKKADETSSITNSQLRNTTSTEGSPPVAVGKKEDETSIINSEVRGAYSSQPRTQDRSPPEGVKMKPGAGSVRRPSPRPVQRGIVIDSPPSWMSGKIKSDDASGDNRRPAPRELSKAEGKRLIGSVDEITEVRSSGTEVMKAFEIELGQVVGDSIVERLKAEPPETSIVAVDDTIEEEEEEEEEGEQEQEQEQEEGPKMVGGKKSGRLNRVKPLNCFILFIYRVVIILRLFVLCVFVRYRIARPVKNAYYLWLPSVICEIWFGISWVLDQFPKWNPITRKTYVETLRARFWKEGEASKLLPIDVFVSTVDPLKEPPLVTANTVLSILAVDYPVDKVACYISDDGATMLTSETTMETAQFARLWVPFCKKHNIEPRAPEAYFNKKFSYLKDCEGRGSNFVKERRVIKRWYGEFKARIKFLVEQAQKVPDEGWTMRNGAPWPANDGKNHGGMIQRFLGHTGAKDINRNELPQLIYISREKNEARPHHKKAGAMNALVRASAVLSNGACILNVDCDHYFNNSCALLEAMCFMMDPKLSRKICFVQFPQRFDGIDEHDRYANRNVVFFDINMKGLDGIQGPVYVGTGCCFSREALYGFYPVFADGEDDDHGNKPSSTAGRIKRRLTRLLQRERKKEKRSQRVPRTRTEALGSEEDDYDDFERYGDHTSLLRSQENLERRFGLSILFIESTFMENGGLPPSANPAFLLDEAMKVIGCSYEDNCDWGKEIGWIYGSVTEDILTGFKMHTRGWRSIYCMPRRPAFKGTAPINLTYRLDQVLRWALGSVEILFSRHCPIWYGYRGGLKVLERVAYINTAVYPLTSLPLVVYCVLPAICLISGKFITPTVDFQAMVVYAMLFGSILFTGALEMFWGGIGITNWWKNEQFWVVGGTSAHLLAVFQGLLKVVVGIDTNFTVTSKATADDDDEFAELYIFRFGYVLIPPLAILFVNAIGLATGLSNAINHGHHQTMAVIYGKLFFAGWVIVHLIPFFKGLIGRLKRIPTIICMWSILIASVFSLLWVRIDPFVPDREETMPVW